MQRGSVPGAQAYGNDERRNGGFTRKLQLGEEKDQREAQEKTMSLLMRHGGTSVDAVVTR